MMVHPYRESYIDEIAETQGTLFDRLQDESPDADGFDLIRRYMKSETRCFIDSGDVYLATLGPSLLLDYYRREDGTAPKRGKPMRGFAPNWMGQFYARYQWETGQSSRDIVDVITPEWLQTAYCGLHDLDMRLAIEKVSREVFQSTSDTVTETGLRKVKGKEE